MINSANCKLSPPWEEVHSALQAFFKSDSSVIVDDAITKDYTLGISCYSEKKYIALSRLLRQEYNFGNVTLKIFIYLLADRRTNSTSFVTQDPAKLIQAALDGNDLFDRVESRKLMSYQLTYCLFKKEVVQFYNDDLTDLYGLESTLAEDIARQIFEVEDIYFCTSREISLDPID